MRYKRYGRGWYNESQRHSLARQGIKTSQKSYSKQVIGGFPKIPLEFISNEIATRILSGCRYGKELKPEDLVKEYNLSNEEQKIVISESKKKVSENKLKMLNIIRKKKIAVNYSKVEIDDERLQSLLDDGHYTRKGIAIFFGATDKEVDDAIEKLESKKEMSHKTGENRPDYSKEKKLTDFGLKNPVKGKQTKFKTEKTEQKFLYWIEDKDDPSVEFENTVTKSLNKVKEYKKEAEKALPEQKFVIKKQRIKQKKPDYQQEVTYSPTTVEIQEKIEKIKVHPTLTDEQKRERIQKLKERLGKIGHGVGKVSKGFFSTVMTGLVWDPEKEEKEPDYSKKDKKTNIGNWLVERGVEGGGAMTGASVGFMTGVPFGGPIGGAVGAGIGAVGGGIVMRKYVTKPFSITKKQRVKQNE